MALVRAVRDGSLELGGWLIECHHLETGQRVITQRSFADIIGMKRGGPLGYRLATLLDNPALKSSKTKQLSLAIETPIRFKMLKGPSAYGYQADVLVEYCKAILEARRVNAIVGIAAERYAKCCEIFVIACAKTGIMALIDEATGFATDAEKKKDEYRRLFETFIRDEIREWEKEYPKQFFDLIYKLYSMKPTGNNHPQFFGTFIRKYVYQPLANSNGAILDALDLKNPVVHALGGRKHKMHQFLTDSIGLPSLRQHLWQVIGIGNAARNRSDFDLAFKRAFPRVGDQFEINLDDVD